LAGKQLLLPKLPIDGSKNPAKVKTQAKFQQKNDSRYKITLGFHKETKARAKLLWVYFQNR
jgi:hypothetical protein